MQAPMNEYYTEKGYEFALMQMRKMLERQRILAEASAAIASKEEQLSWFTSKAKKEATSTKSIIQQVNKQMDTAISGQFRTKMEETVKETVVSYNDI